MTVKKRNSGVQFSIVIAALSVVLLLPGCGGNKQDSGAGAVPAEPTTASTAESAAAEDSKDTENGMTETADSSQEGEAVLETDAEGADAAHETDAAGADAEGEISASGEDVSSEAAGAGDPVYTLGEDDIGMILLDGLLYMDSGETSDAEPAGESTTVLTSVGSDEIPGRDRESNFGAGFTMVPSRDGKVYVLIEEEWHIFRRPGAVDTQEELEPPAITLVDPANDMLNGITVEASSYRLYPADAAGSLQDGNASGVDAQTEEESMGAVTLEGMHPLDEEVLQMKPLRVRGVKVPYTLGCNIQPDEITVAVYSFNDVGKIVPEDETDEVSEDQISAPEEEDPNVFTPPYYVELDKGQIYSFRAVWLPESAENNGFYGEAEYIFTTN